MFEFTVVLLYPDYMTGDYGADIWVDTVTAPNPELAVREAQQAAHNMNLPKNLGVGDPNDYRMILVLQGDVKVLGDATGIYTFPDNVDEPPAPRGVMVCNHCQSPHVICDATVDWDTASQAWRVSGVSQDGYCSACGLECTPMLQTPEEPPEPEDDLPGSDEPYPPDDDPNDHILAQQELEDFEGTDINESEHMDRL